MAQTTHADQLQIGDTIVVTIKRLGINGEGVGYYRRKAVFVPGALTDEVAKVKVEQVQPRFIEGSILQVVKPSAHRIEPPCAVYHQCGGCQTQHLDYRAHHKAKEEVIRESFARYAGIERPKIRPMIGMDEPWGYRHKAQLQAGVVNGETALGLYAAGSHKLVDISGCPIQHEDINRAAEHMKRILDELGIKPYQKRKKQGILRTVVIRRSSFSGELQITLVVTVNQLRETEPLIKKVRDRIPNAATLALNTKKDDSPLVFGERTRILWGKEGIDERLGNLTFRLSPRAFFQLNPEQTVKLYQAVAKAASLTGDERVVDAYCGTGTIGLWLASSAAEVRGIEDVAEAVEDAKVNAKLNGISNASFHKGKSEHLLPKWQKEGFKPDVVVVDPPRTGCDRKLLDAVLASKPKRFVYVSCNPSTLAKDCSVLLKGGYALEWIQPVDMFPQTSHVECVTQIVLK